MANITTESEVEGSIATVIHVDDSGTDPVRTVLALATKDDLSISIDEDSEDFNPGKQRRTERIRTSNTVEVEVATAVATDLDALETVGIVDSTGKVTFDTGDRRILESNDEYVEVAYFSDEPDFGTVDMEADSDLLHRFADLELTSPEMDPSETPPMVSWTWWVEGGYWFDYSSA